MPRVLPPRCLFALLLALAGCDAKKERPAGDPGDPQPGGPSAADDKAARDEAKKRLKEIGKALHDYHNTVGFFPAGVVGPKGELGLSWRVQLLPYLGEDALYKQFNLKEPWDSEHNKKLVEKMPKVFESPGKKAPTGQTYLRSFIGQLGFLPAPLGVKVPGAPVRPPYPMPPGAWARGRPLTGITDGTSYTLAVAEAAEPVEWTRPDDLPYPPVPKLGAPFPDGFHGLMADGQVHFFPADLKDDDLRALITPQGGEVRPLEVVDKLVAAGKPPKKLPPSEIPKSLRDEGPRQTAVENLRAVVKAMRDHHNTSGFLPAGIAAKDGFGLSWRVQILPLLGEEALYKQFKPDEPWDSETNMKLLDKVPKVFASPGKAAPAGHTFLRTTTGPQGMIQTFPGQKGLPPGSQPGQPVPGRKISGIADGTSLTILVVEAAEAVPWTKPEELPVQGDAFAKKPLTVPKLGGPFEGGFHAAMADGRVTFYRSDYPPAELFKLLTPAGGEPVEPLGEPDRILYSLPPVVAGKK
jgi:hypothetical protein